MKLLIGRSGLALALVVGLALAGLTTAGTAMARTPRIDPPATYTTTIVVTDLDAAGHVLASQTITRPPQPIGTPQRIKGSPRLFMDSGSGGGLPTMSGCRELTVTNKTTTTLGFTAFKFITETNWCWNLKQARTTLGDVVVRIADVDSQYRYRGLNSSFNQTVNDGKRVYRQGYFENCIAKYGCINAYYPSNDSRVYDTGMWAWFTNG